MTREGLDGIVSASTTALRLESSATEAKNAGLLCQDPMFDAVKKRESLDPSPDFALALAFEWYARRRVTSLAAPGDS